MNSNLLLDKHQSSSSSSKQVDDLARALRLCGSRKDLSAGRALHSQISQRGLDKNNTYLANLLVEMYGKCGCLDQASAVFNSIAAKNVYSWNILMTAYTLNGDLQHARLTFDQTPVKNPISWTAIVAAYAQRGHLSEANELFNQMPLQTIAAWNAMITGHALNGDLVRARDLFDRMPKRDTVSWNAMITAYAQSGELQPAKEVFDRAIDRNIVTWTAMLTAYCQYGELLDARALFDEIPGKNLVTWTCMIAAYADAGREEEAILLFKQMDLDGILPDHMSYVTVIDACAKIGALSDGAAIHSDALHAGISRLVVIGTALITMYGRCGRLPLAEAVFESMPVRSNVSWSAMIAACVQNGQQKQAVRTFQLMDLEGVESNEITFVSVFDACSNLPADLLAYGKLLHATISDAGFGLNQVLVTALINLYGKSGSLPLARQIFDGHRHRNDVVLWTAMITAYAQNGIGSEAARLFQEMHVVGVEPNAVTVLSMLSISSHSGKLDDGLGFFRSLDDYQIAATVEHFVCLVDLLGRLGKLSDAEDLINQMPYEPQSVPWMTLLSSCRVYRDAQRGERIANELVKLDSDSAAPYVLISLVA